MAGLGLGNFHRFTRCGGAARRATPVGSWQMTTSRFCRGSSGHTPLAPSPKRCTNLAISTTSAGARPSSTACTLPLPVSVIHRRSMCACVVAWCVQAGRVLGPGVRAWPHPDNDAVRSLGYLLLHCGPVHHVANSAHQCNCNGDRAAVWQNLMQFACSVSEHKFASPPVSPVPAPSVAVVAAGTRLQTRFALPSNS